jgi:hypothetical protein
LRRHLLSGFVYPFFSNLPGILLSMAGNGQTK